jgi:hypothetical protein
MRGLGIGQWDFGGRLAVEEKPKSPPSQNEDGAPWRRGIHRWRDDRREWQVISGEWREKAEEKVFVVRQDARNEEGSLTARTPFGMTSFPCVTSRLIEKNATEERQAE